MNWRKVMRLFYAIGSTCAVALLCGATAMSGQTGLPQSGGVGPLDRQRASDHAG
jgi:hypothetical protein